MSELNNLLQQILEEKNKAKTMKRLFLDDYRHPYDCISYMHKRIGKDNPEYAQDWDVVKSHNEFVKWIEKNGLPDLVSFDHDLADEHYAPEVSDDYDYNAYYENFREATGYDSVKWLCNYCAENSLSFPKHFTHSMNPVGYQNIERYIQGFKNNNH